MMRTACRAVTGVAAAALLCVAALLVTHSNTHGWHALVMLQLQQLGVWNAGPLGGTASLVKRCAHGEDKACDALAGDPGAVAALEHIDATNPHGFTAKHPRKAATLQSKFQLRTPTRVYHPPRAAAAAAQRRRAARKSARSYAAPARMAMLADNAFKVADNNFGRTSADSGNSEEDSNAADEDNGGFSEEYSMTPDENNLQQHASTLNVFAVAVAPSDAHSNAPSAGSADVSSAASVAGANSEKVRSPLDLFWRMTTELTFQNLANVSLPPSAPRIHSEKSVRY